MSMRQHLLEKGMISWAEMMSTGAQAAKSFYEEVFGRECETREMECGGQVLHGPMEIPGIGSFAVLKDPTGGVNSPVIGAREKCKEHKPVDGLWFGRSHLRDRQEDVIR